MFNRKNKAITFSYDDGVTQDIRLVNLFNKYNLKATFNLNSEYFGREGKLKVGGVEVNHNKVNASDVRHIYEGHEIASHTLTHPRLPTIENDAEIIRQVEEDRLQLSEFAGYEVVGFAYPCGGVNYDRRVSELIRKNTGIKYCRTIVSSHSFDLQTELYEFMPTVYHRDFDKMFELAERFLSESTDEPKLFYIWGHSYELDAHNGWEQFEELCKMISGRSDVFYGTNKEVLLK